MKQLNIAIDDELYDELAEVARYNHTTPTEVARMAIRDVVRPHRLTVTLFGETVEADIFVKSLPPARCWWGTCVLSAYPPAGNLSTIDFPTIDFQDGRKGRCVVSSVTLMPDGFRAELIGVTPF